MALVLCHNLFEGPNAHDVFVVVKSGNDVFCCHYVAVVTVRIT